MPLYEYLCECGEVLEALEAVGAARATCGELCPHAPGRGGAVERMFSTGLLRGTGHEAKAPTFDPCKRSRRPGDDCA